MYAPKYDKTTKQTSKWKSFYLLQSRPTPRPCCHVCTTIVDNHTHSSGASPWEFHHEWDDEKQKEVFPPVSRSRKSWKIVLSSPKDEVSGARHMFGAGNSVWRVIFMAIVDCLGKARSLFEFSLKKIAHSKALLLSALFISPQVHNPVTPHKDLVQSYDKQRIPRMLHYYHSFSSFSFIEMDPGTTTVKLSLFSKKL